MRRKIFVAIVAALLALCSACSQKKAELELSVLRIGAADCIILISGEHAVMIDAGEDDDGAEITSYLVKKGVTALDCLVLTHFDKDHIGGADAVLASVQVKRVLMPDYEKDGKQYEQLTDALAAANIVPEALTADTSFSLGDMQFSVRVPHKTAYAAGDNDFSLVTMLTFGEKRFLFAGDAEAERLSELLAEGGLACDVLKMPHHGRMNENTAAFLDACAPGRVIITDSDKSPAEAELLELLAERNIDVFQTKDGNIRVVSDGGIVAAEQS